MTTPAPGAEAAAPARHPAVGYAVVGLGWIAQAAVLPAFHNARRNSRLVALVSGDEAKRRVLADHYGIAPDAACDYDAYERCLERTAVDAVYIAVPNHLHREYTVRAAEKGVHVLCEKPMAVTAADCQAMIDACRHNGVRLMIAYRLHLDPANLHAVKLVGAGAIGATRLFTATFSQQVQEGDVRLLPPDRGGGPIYDIGIYCINAARYLFRAEPRTVWASALRREQPRFADAEETVSCVLQFSDARLAAFTCSFGAHPVSAFHLVGEVGEVRLANAFAFKGARAATLRTDAGDERQEFPDADQFGPQLIYFSDCIIHGREPEPDGEEGQVDVRIIEALYDSLRTGRPASVSGTRQRRPDPDQALACPPVREPDLVREAEPSGE
jgi:predicted dehydrogenase